MRRVGGVAAAVGVVVFAGACSLGGPAAAPPAVGGSGSAATASSTPPAPDPKVTVQGRRGGVSYRKPVRLHVESGTFTKVRVKGPAGPLQGEVSHRGTQWTSDGTPLPKSHYTVTARVRDADGAAQTKRVGFDVKGVPPEHRLTYDITPDDDQTVGIGQPIVVRFTSPVTRRAAVERNMLVDATSPSGKSVHGSWHWLSSLEAHWRPKHFWHTGTRVHLKMDLAGVRASDDRWGRKPYAETFHVGSSRVLEVSAKTHMMRVYVDGHHVRTWRTGTGQSRFPTYNGTYIVLGKSQVVQMDSCSAKITCDKKDPDYYDEKVHWAVRLTASGTFVHAAPWDGLMGRANTSHGCIHLSTEHAEHYYDVAKPGDVVIVTGSNKGPEERVAGGDPGLVDWNVSWSQWRAGSALH